MLSFIKFLSEETHFMSRDEAHARISEPNSSGQGHDSSHIHNPYHQTLTKHGFQYSHSTPVGTPAGDFYVHHTYRHPVTGRHVGVSPTRTGSHKWESSKATSSGRHLVGMGAERHHKHLKGSNK